jgi:polyhydroxyalkanoate synthesis regulator phasin
VLEEFRRLALFTSGVAELTRHRAEQLVREMVGSGEVRRDQASSLVKQVVDFSKQNRRELIEFVRSEIRNQLSALGVPSKRDLQRIERRVERLEVSARKQSARRPSAKKTPAKKTTPKSAQRRRPPSKSPPSGEGAPDQPEGD